MDVHELRPILSGNTVAEGFAARAGDVLYLDSCGLCPVWHDHARPVLRNAADKPRGVWLVVLRRPGARPVCLEGADWDDVRQTLKAATGEEPEPGQPARRWEETVLRNARIRATVLHTPTADGRF